VGTLVHDCGYMICSILTVFSHAASVSATGGKEKAVFFLLTCFKADSSATSSSCRLLITSLPMNWYFELE
jgi:hypothetical protein